MAHCLYSPAARRHRRLTGTHCTYPLRDGQAELTWVAGHIPIVRHRELNADTVTHPSTNRARRRVTSLMCATPLPLSQSCHVTNLLTLLLTLTPVTTSIDITIMFLNSGNQETSGWKWPHPDGKWDSETPFTDLEVRAVLIKPCCLWDTTSFSSTNATICSFTIVSKSLHATDAILQCYGS